ncbi:MAG: methyltransferase [Lysobacteraceae bacterium]|nr:MAG: methyltransferase [Xanthomonadaceae bacterium]
MSKRYDRAYFDRWYRGPAGAGRRALTARKAALAVAVCEYYLGRPVQSVLDVGCGEGPWRAPLLRLRPKLHYLGLDSSEYAIARFGRSRNLRLARFGQLAELRFSRSFDLLVCSDVLHYLPAAEIQRGLSGFPELCHGLAYIDVFCRGDPAEGDHEGFVARPPAFYARAFAAVGLRPVGSHCYLLPAWGQHLSRLEQPGFA